MQKSFKYRWGRLGYSIILAVGLALLLLFLPVTAGTVIQIPVPLLPQTISTSLLPTPLVSSATQTKNSINLTLPLGAELVYATGGLTITKSSPATVNHGETLTYTLIITNNTGQDITNAYITDTLPSNTSNCQAPSQNPPAWGGFCTSTEAQWALIYAPPVFPDVFTNTNILTFSVLVDKPLPNGFLILNNSYFISATGTSSFTDTGSGISTIVNAPEWQITKTANPAPNVEPGNPLTYTLNITNSGNLTVTETYTIFDQIPNDTNYVTNSATPTPTSIGSGITWVMTSPLGINQGVQVSYVVTVTNPLTNNTALVNQTYSVSSTDVFSTGIGLPVTVYANSPVTMTVAKTDSPDPVQAGALLSYTITITNENSSKGPAEGLVFSDTTPTNTVFDSAAFLSGSGTISNPTVGGTGAITWSVSSVLGLGQSVQLILYVRVQSPLVSGTLLTNDTYGLSVSNTLSSLAGIVPVTTTVNSAPNITFTKSVDPLVTFTNQPITYTITVTNSGNETALNIPFTDTLPAGFSPTTENWTLTVPGQNLAGAPGINTYSFNATASSIPGVYGNFVTAFVTSNISIGPVATVTVNSPVDLQLTKIRTGGSGYVVAGNQITYTLTITNLGPDMVDAIVTDTFTGSVTAISASPSAGICSSTNPIICNLSNFTNTETIVIVLTTSPSFSGSLINTGLILPNLSGTIDANLADNISTVTTTVLLPTADLQISKVRNGSGDVLSGDSITYTITITNAGPDTISSIDVTDIFTNATGGSFTPSGSGSCPSTVSPVVCTFTNFTNTETIVVVLDSSVAFSGTMTNTAWITFSSGITGTDNSPGNNVSQNVVTPIRYPQADLQIDKVRNGSGVVIAGNSITYTITITNTGPDTISTVEVTDIFTNATGVSFTPSGSGSCPSTVSPVVCTFTNFTNTETIAIVLGTSSAFSGTVTNTAWITFSSSITGIDNIPSNNTSNDIVVPAHYPQADLQVSKARVSSGTVLSGEAITYTITITNAGPDTPSSVEVSDIFTDAANISSISYQVSSGGSCSGITSPVVCTFNNFTNTETITLVLNTSATFSGTITNTAFITFAAGFIGTDNNSTNNVSNDIIVPVHFPQADLQVSKQRVGGTGQIYAGSTITYTLIVTNASGADIVDAILTDTITTVPGGGTTALTSTAGAGVTSCSDTLLQMVCTLNNFTNTSIITVVVTMADAYSGTITNTALITFASGVFATDPAPSNNQDEVSNSVGLALIDLQVNKQRSNGSGTVYAGNPITYTLTVTNPGPLAVDITLTDIFSPTGTGVTYNSIITPTGAVCSGSGPVICTMSNLSGTASFILTLDTVNTYIGPVTNTATIMTSSPNVSETNTTNNTDTVTDTVDILSADLQIDKVRVGSGGILPGDALTFTLTITNAGPDTVIATLQDTVSPGSAINDMSIIAPAGWSCSPISLPTINCSNNTFSGGPVVATVMITTTPTFSGALANTGTIGNAAVEIDSSDNSSTVLLNVTPTITPILNITKTASPASNSTVNPGDTINYMIEVSNSGTDAATNVVITDVLPGEVGYVSCSSNATSCTGSSTTIINMSSLATGATLTATIEVTVTAPVSGAQITNSASFMSDQTALVSSNLVTHTVITATVGDVYLPIIMKNYDGACAELQITNIQNLGGNVVGVTVENVGTCATDGNFWVDIYGNIQGTQPNNLVDVTADRRWASTSVNAQYGLGWEVLALGASVSRTLTTDGSNGFGPTSPDQNWPASLGGATVIAYADSYDINDPENTHYVEIRETNESNNQSSSITVSGVGVAEVAPTSYPPRPDLH